MKTHAPQKDRYKNVYSHFIHGSQNLKQPHCPSTGERINIAVYLYNSNLLSNKKIYNNMDESYSIILSKKPDTLTVWLNLYKF